MKYIDEKKLIAEIERLKSTNPSEYNYQNAEGYIWALDDIKKVIDYLQQEQPIGEEYAIEIGKYTHTLRVGSKSDIDNLIRQEKQEQPEVDLEKEIEKMWNVFIETEAGRGAFSNIARYFYELGRLNARKEK